MASKNIGRARIMQEHKNLLKQKLQYLHAQPLESDLYTWHFTFRGPQNTQFHEGLYHGQILLPFQYPFKPPDIIFFNKNGRFQVNTKICLTITQYHTQQWNSAWTIRTMLEAVISLFNQKVVGHGYVESSGEIKRFCAKQSHKFVCEKCGKISQIIKPRPPMGEQQQKVIQKIQQKQHQVPQKKLAYKHIVKKQQPRQSNKRTEEKQEDIQKKKGQPPQKLKKVKRKKQENITPQQYFLSALKQGNNEYLQVMRSKKFVK